MRSAIKIGYCWLLAVLLLCTGMEASATRRALVIGIGTYPESSGWAKINGDKDVPTVVSMLQQKDFHPGDIITLVNEQATAEAIRNAFATLLQQSQKRDFVYIHFSGHGQRITDTNGDEAGGYDEAWVPYDAPLSYKAAEGFIFKRGGYSGQNHLIDDELNEFLYNLRKKVGDKGKIIVVADACHSGGSTRELNDDNEPLVVRGVRDDFIIPAGVRTAPVGGHPIAWVFISACKSTQCNYEYQGVGSLTYALSQLVDRFEQLTCAQLENKIRAVMRDIIPCLQTPAVETPAAGAEALFF